MLNRLQGPTFFEFLPTSIKEVQIKPTITCSVCLKFVDALLQKK
jgi:hypothetical protein